MKSKGIILVVLLCIFAISGCSKETNTTTTDSETRSTQITASEETSAKNEMTIVLKDNETASDKSDAVIVECNGLSYELAVGGEEWQKMADFLDSISK